ncbi:MAG TPA: CBO0543 family protein [Clostridiaceae bacterium]
MFYKVLIDISENPLWKEIVKARILVRDLNLKHWLGTNVFSLVWWFMVISFLIAWFVWWKLVNKSRFAEIVTYGLLVAMVSIILDIIGTSNVIWGYPNMLVPLAPPMFYADMCSMPVIYMLIYQYFRSWKSFIIAMTITAFIIAFIGEPIAVRLDIYELNSWKYLYSFPLYILIAIMLKWINNKIYSI